MVISRRLLSRGKTLAFLKGLEAEAQSRTLYIPPESGNQSSEPLNEIPPELLEVIPRSKTGAVLFLSSSRIYLVLPPFPVRTLNSFDSYVIEPLYSLLEHDFTLALVLVRLGSFAVGVSHGENLVTSKVGTGLVHARHRQGGSSQQRFRRHREKQIEYFLTRTCSHVHEQLEPHAQLIDYIIYGGAWTTIRLLNKRCPFLSRFDNRTLPPLLDIPDPRQYVLEDALARVWSSQLIEWHNNNAQED